MPQLEEHHGEKIEDQTIVLDGKHYTNCTFINCELVFRGGPTVFEGNDLEETSFSFDGAAARTIRFLRGLNQTGGEPAVNDVIEVIRNSS